MGHLVSGPRLVPPNCDLSGCLSTKHMSDGQSSTVQSSSSNPSSTLSSDTPSGSSLSTDTQPTASPSVNSSTTAPSASESDDTPLLSSTAPGSSSNNSTIANTSAAQSTSATVSSTSSSLTVVADPVTSATISSGNSTSSTSTAADRLGSSLSFNAGLTPPSTVSDHPSPAHAPSQNTTPSHPASFTVSTTAPVSTAQSDATTSRHKSHTTAIAGGIVGALVFLLLGALLFYRRPLLKRLARVHLPLRKASHTAPSAEFMNHPAVIQRRSSSALLRTASPFSYVNGAGANIAHPLGAYPYADSAEGNPFDEPPPPFTVGGFSDPIIEKASASAAAHMHMFEDRAGSSAVGAPPDHYEDGEVPYDGMSEVGHAV